jgi:hypothetical protein
MIALPIGWMKFLSSKGLKGTTWEHGRNTSATHEKKTSPPSPVPPKPKLKSWGAPVDAAPSHWLHAISISKTVGYPFGLG